MTGKAGADVLADYIAAQVRKDGWSVAVLPTRNADAYLFADDLQRGSAFRLASQMQDDGRNVYAVLRLPDYTAVYTTANTVLAVVPHATPAPAPESAP